MTTITEDRPMIRETENGKEKWCSGCRDYHPADEEHFYRDAKSATGLSSWCRKAQKANTDSPGQGGPDQNMNRRDFWEDPQGRFVHVDNIKEIDKARDDLVRRLVARAMPLQKALRDFKEFAFDEVYAFVDISAQDYDVQMGGKKGNMNLPTYDGKFRVQIQNAEDIVFDERLKVAKELIDQCLSKWTEGSRAEIRTIINDAFNVNQAGKIDTRRILALRRLDIADADWRKAMEAISDSLTVSGSKSYLRVYERIGREDKWRHISLDFANL